jgi:hypothetical protein
MRTHDISGMRFGTNPAKESIGAEGWRDIPSLLNVRNISAHTASGAIQAEEHFMGSKTYWLAFCPPPFFYLYSEIQLAGENSAARLPRLLGGCRRCSHADSSVLREVRPP